MQRVLYLFVQGSGHRGFFWICTNGVPSEQCAMKKGCRRPSCRVSWRARPRPVSRIRCVVQFTVPSYNYVANFARSRQTRKKHVNIRVAGVSLSETVVLCALDERKISERRDAHGHARFSEHPTRRAHDNTAAASRRGAQPSTLTIPCTVSVCAVRVAPHAESTVHLHHVHPPAAEARPVNGARHSLYTVAGKRATLHPLPS